ncbi:hypothetical protein [Mumia sp. DW29H23]
MVEYISLDDFSFSELILGVPARTSLAPAHRSGRCSADGKGYPGPGAG